MRIWKFGLAVTDEQRVVMPRGAQVLTVQTQHGQPQLWALCDELETQRESRAIAIYGTGNPIPDEPGQYIGTFQLHGGALVFHAFEVTT